ncbi:hypothetical protein LOK49_LG02G01769 [Camellia lanceoleosa]|uniref:Uncharacterized protein n=1 Tax=Camellia lanceoleosa TaxID=1840588 RepID=A0ACC0IIW2_9ERIC|nr:hypothetical protein LOK49_LG02G01769 [Camellia lanceoleosa]
MMEQLLGRHVGNLFVDLNCVIVEKDSEIDRLSKVVDRLELKISNLQDSLDDFEVHEVTQCVVNNGSNQRTPSNSFSGEVTGSGHITSVESAQHSACPVGQPKDGDTTELEIVEHEAGIEDLTVDFDHGNVHSTVAVVKGSCSPRNEQPASEGNVNVGAVVVGVGLTVLDGTHLRSVDLSLPETNSTVTGSQLLELAESRVSVSLFGLSLPQNLKSSALNRLNIIDDVSFRPTELERDQALSMFKDYLTAIADELKEEPLVVAILDGKTLRLFLEDEDDFAMLAENLFTDLDVNDKGKINKNEIRNALGHMGVELGIPPFSEFPLLNDILQRHGADGEEELGQAQFAQLLQAVLQELAEALAEKHVVVIQNIKIINGSKLRKLLASEEKLNAVIEKMLQQEKNSEKDAKKSTSIIRSFLEENEKELGLPSSEAGDSVVLLYDAVFTDVGNTKSAAGSKKDDFQLLVKEILEKFAEQLEANPVFEDLEN